MEEIRRKVYTVKDIQEITKLGRNSVLNLLHSGRLKFVRAGRRILIPAWALEEFLNKTT